MRDIREEANPYRDNYLEWDFWSYVNEVESLKAEGITNIWLDKPGWQTMYVEVDAAGWIVPQVEAYRQRMERMKYGADADTGKSACTNTFVARGKPGRRMMMELHQAKQQIKAVYIPNIPRWLTNGPPESAMLLPDGEVVSYGQVGNQDIMWPDRRSDLLSHYRYDAAGSILRQTESEQPWWNLYFDLDGELAKYGEDSGLIASRPGYVGIIHHTDDDDGVPTRIEWFTYKGDDPSSVGNPELTDQTQFMEIYAAEIPVLYELQQLAQGSGT